MEEKDRILEVLRREQIIFSIKTPKALDHFLESDITIGFLLEGSINNLQNYVKVLKNRNKIVFLHLEKVQGIRVDFEGLQFLSHYIKPHGIITTKKQLIRSAKSLGFCTVQRLFLVDTDAVQNGLQIAKEFQPDFIEVMPGLISCVFGKIKQTIDIPLITGGLISDEEQIQKAINHGALAVSTSRLKLGQAFLDKGSDPSKASKGFLLNI
ncbi:glycerol-3-phosphate responsive antiterminator [Pullulanibacillus sp. KACC 23026]|uniref:glycerol-3-phosphate responsive antiterminator n=1 Tax=Pullulanibacillus sp. KACC 23026 TaxID=3028315 RepID=UPI0023B06FC0|nr:glycerol-3-phosphate responsive antiterminator [Pullulanibacillus sp. KACC 23026]WEG13507.1 glycerol-3-phosphate responsive antiterminator [Pullulanibacillus sp. KACC 23026]